MKNRSFWNTCSRNCEYFPEDICPQGKLGVDSKEALNSCQWFINNPESNYCFWKWIRSKSDNEGSMDALSLHEIASLLCIPSSKIQIIFKEVMEKIKDFEELKKI